jgi:hypothetical protein
VLPSDGIEHDVRRFADLMNGDREFARGERGCHHATPSADHFGPNVQRHRSRKIDHTTKAGQHKLLMGSSAATRTGGLLGDDGSDEVRAERDSDPGSGPVHGEVRFEFGQGFQLLLWG